MSRYFQDRTLGQNKKLRTRGVLFDSALVIFCKQGISNTRLEDITQYAGIANATFYNHFKDKDELLFELATAALSELVEFLDKALAGINDPPIRIVLIIYVIMNTALEHEGWRLFLGQSPHLVPTKLDYLVIERFIENVTLGVEEGLFPSEHDWFEMHQVRALLHSGVGRLGKKHDVNIIDRTSENILRLLGMSSADARLAVDKGRSLYELK